jgi:hypothetical protein
VRTSLCDDPAYDDVQQIASERVGVHNCIETNLKFVLYTGLQIELEKKRSDEIIIKALIS